MGWGGVGWGGVGWGGVGWGGVGWGGVGWGGVGWGWGEGGGEGVGGGAHGRAAREHCHLWRLISSTALRTAPSTTGSLGEVVSALMPASVASAKLVNTPLTSASRCLRAARGQRGRGDRQALTTIQSLLLCGPHPLPTQHPPCSHPAPLSHAHAAARVPWHASQHTAQPPELQRLQLLQQVRHVTHLDEKCVGLAQAAAGDSHHLLQGAACGRQ